MSFESPSVRRTTSMSRATFAVDMEADSGWPVVEQAWPNAFEALMKSVRSATDTG